MSEMIALASQFLMWPICYIFFNLFFKLEIHGRDNLNSIRSPFILISNHIAIYDSFVFRLAFSVFDKKLPLRFMAVNKFDSKCLNFLSKIGIITFVYKVFGVFVIHQGRGIYKNLIEATKIVKNGGNVVVYPEGSIFRNDMVNKFKYGAAVLAKTTGASVLPVSLRIIKGGIRRRFIVNIGRDIKYNDYDSIEEITRVFRNVVGKLYKQD